MLSYARNVLSLFTQDKRAVTAIEYALIAALIAVVIIGAVSALGGNISSNQGLVASGGVDQRWHNRRLPKQQTSLVFAQEYSS